MKEVIVDVTPSKVNQAVDDLRGQAAHGRLDFDEFLYALAEMDEKPDEEEQQQEEEGQTIDKKKRKGKDLIVL